MRTPTPCLDARTRWEQGAALNVTARVQYAPLYEPPTGIETLTPLDYALRYAQGRRWRQSEREAATIRYTANR